MDEHFKYLVIAMLAVNNYPLERVWRQRSDLEKLRVFDPTFLATAEEDHIARALEDAGYQRGDYINGLLASRLKNLGHFAITLGHSRMKEVLEDRGDLSVALRSVGGIGPVVIRNFIALRDTPD
jgi:hypothetical protein